jgi:phage RecT family recombinase
MSVSTEVARMDVILSTLRSEGIQTHLKNNLPPEISVDKFTSVTIAALNNNPELATADSQSLYSAIIKAAQDNLLPDGREGALVIFNTNVAGRDQPPMWVKKVQWMPMMYGLRKRLGEIGILIDAQVVHENDDFVYEFGDNPTIAHKPPKLGKPRGEIIGTYAVATLKDGSKMREVMDKDQVQAVRAQSRAANSLMWTKFESEGYRKTVARRLVKSLPITDQKVLNMLKADDEQFTFEQEGNGQPDPAAQTEASAPPPAADAPKPPRPKALEAVVQATKPLPTQPEKVAVTPAPKAAAKPVTAAPAPSGDESEVF